MNEIMERILRMMDGIEEEPHSETKSWILGQIAENISKGGSVWTIHGYADGSGEILDELLEELGVSYESLTCQDGIYTISVR